jgi:hypothetical protein
MPPAFRNNRVPTARDIPASSAASSLAMPAAIAAQNRRCSSRPATTGRPGENKGARPDRSERRLLRLVTVTSPSRCCDDHLSSSSHCRSQRPLKDVRARRLSSLFGTVEVRAPRFLPCRCAVTRRHTLNPVAEIMPDRCTPEYECVIAKMGSLLPYRRARTLLSDFLPLGDVPAVETSRRRTMRVGARLEQLAVASHTPAPAAEAQAIALSVDGGMCGQSEVIRFARSR